jgi:hypothetical protein
MRNISDVEPSSFEEEDMFGTLCRGQKTNQWFLPNGSIRSKKWKDKAIFVAEQ